MTNHKRLGASSRHRWSMCPGSIRECAEYPPTTNEYAIDGTRTHTLLEHCIKNAIDDPFSCVGHSFDDEHGGFTVDLKRAGRVKIAIDYIAMRKAELGQCVIESEYQTDMLNLFRRDDIGGTMDVMLMNSKVIEVIDYKDGMTPVRADGNKQLELYAWGAIAYSSRLNQSYPKVETIRMTIIQPKLMVKGMPAISFVDVRYFDFAASLLRIIDEAKATDDPQAQLIAGEHCNYCPHSSKCAALAKKSLEFVGVNVSLPDFAQQSADCDPENFNDERLVEVVESAPMIRKFLEAVEVEALKRLNAGKAIPGLKLVNGLGSRKWAYLDIEMEDKLTKVLKVPKSAIYCQKLISPAQAANITWIAKGETKKLSAKQHAILENELISFVAGKPALALDSDRRQAVNNDASRMFGPIESKNKVQGIPSWLIT